MGGSLYTRRLLVGMAAMFLVGACAASATLAPAGTTAAPRATALRTAGPVTSISGTATCATRDLGSGTTGSGGVQHFVNGTLECTVSNSDPRVSGIETATPWMSDLWGTTDKGAGVQWGPSHLQNAGGAWDGKGSGVFSSDRGDIVAAWYEGTGGYAGLVYFELWTGTSPWNIRGEIFTGDVPGPTGTLPSWAATPKTSVASGSTAAAPLATAIAYGPVSVATGTYTYSNVDVGSATVGPRGVTRYVNGLAYGVERLDDPRVTANFTGSPWTMDVWGTIDSGAGIQWGPSLSKNSGGAWDCFFSGIYDGRGDTMVAWCKGADGYAGLGYFELDTSRDPFGMSKPDYADGTIHSEIFPGDPPTL